MALQPLVTPRTSSSTQPGENSGVVPMACVVGLFFMWGFLTCLNDILMPHLKALFDLNYAQASLVQFTFFSAYFLVAIPAGKVVSAIGFRLAIVAGLAVAGVGSLLFIIAAYSGLYFLFLSALFLLASGITLLQVAANPYVTLLGSSASAPKRLNLAQAFNALGTTLAPWFGSVFILQSAMESALHPSSVSNIVVPYFGLGVTLFLLATVMFVIKIPAISVASEHTLSIRHNLRAVLSVRHLRLGIIAIFLYVGAEVSIGSYLVNFLSDPLVAALDEKTAARYVSLYWGGAMIGRFIGSALMARIRAEKLLAYFAAIACLLVALTISSAGTVAMIAILSVGFFNSIMFPSIFALAIADLGDLTSTGSSLLVMAIVGGALIPSIQGLVADSVGLQAAFFIPAACYLYILYFSVYGCKPALEISTQPQ